MSYTPEVTHERADLQGISFSVDDEENELSSTNISPVAYSRSDGQGELKQARGVRDPSYQRKVLKGRKIVWRADQGLWVYENAPGDFDMVVEATTEV